MPEADQTGTIDVVRGRLSDDVAEEVLRFWAAEGVLEGDQARARLPEVICVLRDDAGEIAGVNSTYPENVALISGRRFWIYRSHLNESVRDAGPAMIKAAFEALESEFDPGQAGPIGICLAIADLAEMKRRPEAEWTDPRIIYAGYLPDGRQLRIGYFAGAKI
jgi:hypothetical protein